MSDTAAPGATKTGLTPLELAQDVLVRIDKALEYARHRRGKFRWRASAVRVSALALSATSTIILGWQDLDFWSGLAFSLVALTTAVNTLEPFFAWRSRWVLMEETQYRLHRLHDDLSYYLAAHRPDQLDLATVTTMFERYQGIWESQSDRWLEYRRTAAPGG
ncbi:MAG TPA: SLATT domain-containing protein [Actinophytocola sp.]|uniref:SLATT domain-containing protein n=1 Tax=Actinophytocola sp. TaxID=1872138 RepID=UPI002DDD979C|nr:SLATT domain-containing protein [Actinophytocola sp.]HEV2778616.1 SLATT domain-containing protein [Actinophytocola sp.]